MNALLQISRLIDWINEKVGKAISWLIITAVLVSSLNALSRFAFNRSSNAWLELQWYLFGAVFLLGAGYTLKNNEHIRIDIVNARLSVRTRNIIDLIGHVFFLLPLCILMLWLSVPFFIRSFMSGEVSSSAGGLIIWPAKILIPLGFMLLFLQAISELIKRSAIIMGRLSEPESNAGTHAPTQ